MSPFVPRASGKDALVIPQKGVSFMMMRSFIVAAACAVLPAFAGAAGNLLVNPGAESGDLTGWTPSLGELRLEAVKAAPGRFGLINPFEGEYFFAATGEMFPPDRGSAGLQQTVALPDIGSPAQAKLSFRGHVGEGFFSDFVVAQAQFFDGEGAWLGQFSTSDERRGGNWSEWSATSLVPQGARSAQVSLHFFLKSGSELDAYADNVSFSVSAVPEADAVALALAGMSVTCIAGAARRRRLSA